jgi:hypothetical protein
MQVSNILITFYSSDDGYIKINLRGWHKTIIL